MIEGYKMGKMMAQLMKKQKEQQNKNKPQNNSSNIQNNTTGNIGNKKITIDFNKGGTITKIKMNSDAMVAELINEYFQKSGTTNGTFNFNGNYLQPDDCTPLNEAGLKNGDQIIVN